MALTQSQIFLYAAGPHDYANAQEIASTYHLPFGNVTGSFAMAYAAIASGKFLVIAVGGAANDNLYYNPQGWAGLPADSTPFDYVDSSTDGDVPPIDVLPGANWYENAAGSTAQETYQIAADYVAYALGESIPYSPIPSVLAPSNIDTGSNPIYAGSSEATGP